MQPLKHFCLPLILILCVVNGARAQDTAEPYVNVDSLINYASGESKKGNFGETAAAARKLLAYGKGTNDKTAILYGLIYTGHSLAREVNDSVKYCYKQAHELASELGDYRALATINNALAIYTSEMEMNYLGGLTYFMEALDYAEQSPDFHSYPVILNNIAMAHYLRNDPNGLKYSLEVVDIGTAGNDSLLVYSGSFVTAYMYYLLEDYATALGYMESALDAGGQHTEFAEAYSLYANILVKIGREKEAVGYYKRSLEYTGEEKSNVLAYLNYGSYLIKTGAASEAIGILEKGLDFVNRRNNAFYRSQLYEKLSEASEALGRMDTALEYYKMYRHESDSIFDAARETAINELRVKYEYEKQEKEIHEKKLALLREKQKLNITVFAVIILAGLLVILFTTYRKKNQRYRQIVRQQHELIRKEKVIEELRGYGRRNEGESVTPSDEKRLALFSEFEKLMKAGKIYREKDITIEKAAEKLGTNRSYLSKAINENGGMTFSQYVNSCRIEEARRILSETDNDMQIKALAYDLGFSTPETFSSSFKKTIGMLPTKFREQMRKIYKDSDSE